METLIDYRWDMDSEISTITLNRPDRLNSFTSAMHYKLRDALILAGANKSRAIILTGVGKGFCAGQDLEQRKALSAEDSVDLGRTVREFYNPLIKSFIESKMPIVCAVNGVAAGAGVNIALACDIVVAAQSAYFVQSFSNLNLILDSGGTWNLPRVAGLARAKASALLAEKISADQAQQWGMIWQSVPDAELQQTALHIAERLAAKPPAALQQIRKLMHKSYQNTIEQQLELEAETMQKQGEMSDYREAVNAFLEKRKGFFKNE